MRGDKWGVDVLGRLHSNKWGDCKKDCNNRRYSCKKMALNAYQHVGRAMVAPAVIPLKRLWLMITNQSVMISIINVNQI